METGTAAPGASAKDARDLALLGRHAWLPRSHTLALVIGMLAIGGFASYTVQQNYQSTLDLWRSELGAAARYRAWTVQNSLQQSQDDTQIVADFGPARTLLMSEAHPGAPPRIVLQQQVLGLFQEFQKVYEYGGIYLFDNRGRVTAQVSDSPSWGAVTDSPAFRDVFGTVLRDRHFAVRLGRGSGKELALIFVMPVLANGAPIGVVAIVDPFSRDLLPLLTARSVATLTGETVLMQFAGGEVRYASPLPHAAAAASRFDTLRLAVFSAGNRPAFGPFVDYRGVDVLAAMQTIPSIDSAVVCKIDTAEALAGFHRAVRIETVAALSIFLAYVGLIVTDHRRAVAREMRDGLARERSLNQVLEIKVSQRTSQLVRMNEQLHVELAERLRAEEEIRRFNAELDRRVHDRTVELEAANQELEAFSYSVSHDLRAPLRAVNGFAGIVLEDFGRELPAEGRDYLERIRSRGTQMGCLIDDLLAFSRLGRQPLKAWRVDTAAVVKLALEELGGQCEGREIEIRVGDLPDCYGDAALLKQVWVNLLSNAIKYTRGRAPAIVEIGCDRVEGEDVFRVRDNGTGFDMAYQHKMFGVFQRLHRGDQFEGTGVGLAIVQRVVNRHGGRVWAEAEEGRGATFSFTLSAERAS